MTDKNISILNKIRRGLIVSCQALPDEPMFGSQIMGRMAMAAMEGGAVGIRANTVVDIIEIKRVVNLPVIGIIKAVYEDSDVYITPTIKEVEALAAIGVEIIAIDATERLRPGGVKLASFFRQIRERYPMQLFMADCSCLEDCINAEKIGFDIVGTTLCGYTAETRGTIIPNLDLISKISAELSVPVIAEGGIWERDQLRDVFKYSVHAAVVGTAITRPKDITRRFVEAIE